MPRLISALCASLPLTLLSASLPALMPASQAAAQVTKVTPYFVVASKDAPLRADAGNVYYAVRSIKPGEVLRVDAESKGWLRVEYLPGTPAFVPAAEGELSADAQTLKLKTSSQLLAVDASGVRPWWPLLESPLPAGTSFSQPKVIKAADGTVEGYHVPAPAKARGWIAQAATQKATDTQAASYTGPSGPPAAAPQPAAPATTSTPPAPTTTPATADSSSSPTTMHPVARPQVTNPAKPGETTTTKTTNPDGGTTTTTTTTQPTPPGFELVNESGRTTTKETTRSTSSSTTTPVAPTSTAPAVVKDQTGVPITQRVSDIGTLRSIYDRGMRAGSIAELDEVIKEFDKSLVAMPNPDAKLLNELQKRLEALRLRRDLLAARESSQSLTRTIDERTRSLTMALADVQKQAVYTIVGTMLPSTVYDGSRGMPLLYRIDAPDTFSTRTVGYVVPRSGLELSGKTGRVVGVIGDSKLDPALSVTIVSPTRIDVLNFVEGRYVIESSQTVQSSTTTTTTTTNTTTGPGAPAGTPPPASTPAPAPGTPTPADPGDDRDSSTSPASPTPQ